MPFLQSQRMLWRKGRNWDYDDDGDDDEVNDDDDYDHVVNDVYNVDDSDDFYTIEPRCVFLLNDDVEMKMMMMFFIMMMNFDDDIDRTHRSGEVQVDGRKGTPFTK